ncbi:MAG: homoserine kinase [bacterium]
MPQTARLRIPASTSNLGAGFDTLGLALDLPLNVNVHFDTESTCIISARGEGARESSKLDDHLILHAFSCACREYGQPVPRIALEIDNKIPLKRGLGSSGAAIIAGALAAQIYFDRAWSQEELLNLACQLEGHPENVSASLLGGLTVNGLENGRVVCERFTPPENWAAACFVPDMEIATEDARRVLPASISRREAIGNLQSTAMMVAAFAKANSGLLNFAAKDNMHQPHRKALIPGFDAILAAAMQSGSYCAFLSGSGSTLLAITEDDHARDVTQAMARAGHAHGLTGRPMVLSFAALGAGWEL